MPTFGYALVLCGVLGFLNWGQWQHSRVLAAEAAAVAQERDQAKADLAGIQKQQEALAAALAARDADLNKAREDYERRSKILSAVPRGGCLDAVIDPRVTSLLGNHAPSRASPDAADRVNRHAVLQSQ